MYMQKKSVDSSSCDYIGVCDYRWCDFIDSKKTDSSRPTRTLFNSISIRVFDFNFGSMRESVEDKSYYLPSGKVIR